MKWGMQENGWQNLWKNILENNTTILITGATGFIGSLLVKTLAGWDREDAVRLVLPVRNKAKAVSMYGEKMKQINLTVFESDAESLTAEKLCQYGISVDYIIHCASVTESSEMISHPAEVMDGIILGTRNVLEIARKHRIKSMVYLSSMEVYGIVSEEERPVTEEHLGKVELFSPRSCYPIGKRAAEHYCYIYFREYGVPVKIARLSQIFGKGVREDDNRIFMQFARAIKEKTDIVLHTTGESVGNYCESMDAVRAILTILEKGKNGEAYNIVNEKNTMRIRDMAELAAHKIAGGEIRVTYETQNAGIYGYAPSTGLRLSSEKLRKLGWQPSKSLEQMYMDLLDDLQWNL